MNRPDEILLAGAPAIEFHRFNTVVVGSGAAGLNAAEYLHKHGQKSVAVVTEGVKMGTSRNTGSDKQTYYKLTTCGEERDSVRRMAQTLFEGGCMDGDIALAEAAGSAQCFFHLVDIGVPFPHNADGEYVGYKTDHDPCKRGTSAGPLTSKYMSECLLREVQARDIPIFDGYMIIEILTRTGEDGREAVGVLALNTKAADVPDRRYALFAATNVVYATGGEAGMYETSVYPISQTGGTGNAFRAGVRGRNLTESQYGLASTRFRWNLSGTYQQVLPRYVSTDAVGKDEREFLDEYFDKPEKLLTAIFLKGYQWPFDPRKVENFGSSLIDILVYHEMQFKGRRVFLDYTRNPSRAESGGKFDVSRLEPEVKEYLANSKALLATPIERLAQMNPAAIELYKGHGIDLRNERLEIAVSAQHNNGGLAMNNWWESELRHFFPVGEVSGTHGIYRPGGSALNSGQVGGMRASQYIIRKYRDDPPKREEILRDCGDQIAAALAYGEQALARGGDAADLERERRDLKRRMSSHGAHIRSGEGIDKALAEARRQLERFEAGLAIASPAQLRDLHKTRDLVVCHYVYLSAIKDYIGHGGGSRGSYLIHTPGGAKPAPSLPDVFAFALDSGELASRVQEVAYAGGECRTEWRDVRPVPPSDEWFETVWKKYRTGEIFG